MKRLFATIPIMATSILFLTTSCSPKYTIEENEGFTLVFNQGGATLGFTAESGITLIESGRFAFKDLNRNGILDAYEDWRLPVDERIADLVRQMSVEQIAGLMLYSGHQSIPARGSRFFGGTYEGKSFDESGLPAESLSDQQKQPL